MRVNAAGIISRFAGNQGEWLEPGGYFDIPLFPLPQTPLSALSEGVQCVRSVHSFCCKFVDVQRPTRLAIMGRPPPQL